MLFIESLENLKYIETNQSIILLPLSFFILIFFISEPTPDPSPRPPILSYPLLPHTHPKKKSRPGRPREEMEEKVRDSEEGPRQEGGSLGRPRLVPGLYTCIRRIRRGGEKGGPSPSRSPATTVKEA